MKAIFGIFLWLSAALWLAAEPVRSQHTEAELVADVESVQPGESFWLALRLEMDPHWHTYWSNPGSTGITTSLEWQDLPEGMEIGEIHWPTPIVFEMAGINNYVYEGQVLLMMRATPPADLEPGDTLTLKARADWLECDDKLCVPGGADLEISLPVEDAPPAPSPWANAMNATREDLWPKALPDAWTASAQREGDQVTLILSPSEDVRHHDPGEIIFFSKNAYIGPDDPQTIERGAQGKITIELTKDAYFSGDPDTLPAILRAANGWLPGGEPVGLEIDPAFGAATSAAAGSSDSAQTSGGNAKESGFAERSLAGMIVLAFIGGMILNLMPCVFPVIGLKVMSFVKQAGESRGKVILHGALYTIGVLLSFWAIGLLFEPIHQSFLDTGTVEGGWGAWLTPSFILFLMLLVFVFSLSLSGVFEIGGSMIGVGAKFSSQSGYVGSFTSGLFAVAVGAPCAAPFLAPVLGALVKAPLPTRELLLTVIGLGLAFPYLLLSIFPALTKKLPKPGAWMETFKQGMAFLLYATVAWLLWTIIGQVSAPALGAVLFSLVLAALGCWVFGRWSAPHRKSRTRLIGSIVALLLVIGPGLYAWSMIRESQQRQLEIAEAKASGQKLDYLVWEKWSPEKVNELLAQGRPVYIDFTARWCLTCQVNKRVYNNRELVETFQKYDVATLKADWTNHDPAIGKALAEFDRSAVPFNVLYMPDGRSPVTLPEVLTVSNVEAALKKIGEG